LSETNLTGRSLKQYQLIAKLGTGGMGEVYRAVDSVLGREAAIKVLAPNKLQDPDARQRFLREARAASALNHPSVVTVYEIGNSDGVDFIAMELVSGETLHSVLRQRRLSIAEATGYAVQAADALAKAHAAGVVHRDIKPSNLAITLDGLVKVLDFGLARLNESTKPTLDTSDVTNTAPFATRAGVIMGTVAYMSPEQARGDEAGVGSDIFSLGIVVFEMLSGQRPFDGASDLAMLHNLHFSPAKDLRQLAPEVPESLARIVSRMLEKDPAARYATMVQVRQELRPYASADNSHVVAAATARRRAIPTRKILIGMAVAGALGLAIVGGQLVLSRINSQRVESPAQPSSSSSTPAIDANATPRDLYVKARGLLDRFDREANPVQAITLLERAVSLEPTFAIGFAALTEAYHFRHQVAPDPQWINLMSQNAQRAVTLNPDLAAAHIARGLALSHQKGKRQEAEAAFRQAMDMDPRSAAPHRWMAASPGGTKEQVSESLQQGLALEPTNWVLLQEQGVLHYRAAEYTQAASAFEKARAASPDNVRVLSNLAASYHMLDRYDDAASTLQRAIEIEESPRLLTNLGTLRFFRGQYEEAIPPLEKAVKLAPNRYLYWANLADAYRWSPGQKSKAAEAYGRAIGIVRDELAKKPEDPDLESRLALYLAKSGDKGAALDALQRVERLAPTQAVMLFRIAVAYEVCAMRDKALTALEKAMKAGYAEKEVRGEPELLSLRNDLRFHKIVASLAAPDRPSK
jgi:serine/threonine protein kinase/Flp pilus assembly protein TadD